jgi:hypothetical protein
VPILGLYALLSRRFDPTKPEGDADAPSIGRAKVRSRKPLPMRVVDTDKTSSIVRDDPNRWGLHDARQTAQGSYCKQEQAVCAWHKG